MTKFKKGDKVTHVDCEWSIPEVVREVRYVDGRGLVLFENGGGWIADRLKVVEDER